MIENNRYTLRHSVYPKPYLQAGFHCSQFCAQTSCHKCNKYINMCANESQPCPSCVKSRIGNIGVRELCPQGGP
jgi:hypothetical protein